MGTSTDAHCFACEYDTFLRLGGGMSNHTTFAAWPVACKVCSAVTTANFKRLPLVCLKCDSGNVTPMSDPQEWKGDGKIAQNWSNLTLTDGHYRCPKCGKFELRFGLNATMHDIVSWD